MSEELKPCPSEALEALRNQTQLDMDGCMVGVSRQALDEVLDYVNSYARRASPTPPATEGWGEREGALARLRAAGWSVAVHNDYRLNGVPATFWLFTHPNGRWIKGEGESDDAALCEAESQSRALLFSLPDPENVRREVVDAMLAAAKTQEESK